MNLGVFPSPSISVPSMQDHVEAFRMWQGKEDLHRSQRTPTPNLQHRAKTLQTPPGCPLPTSPAAPKAHSRAGNSLSSRIAQRLHPPGEDSTWDPPDPPCTLLMGPPHRAAQLWQMGTLGQCALLVGVFWGGAAPCQHVDFALQAPGWLITVVLIKCVY